MAEPVTPTPLRAAFEARDLDAVVAALAPDVVLRSPIFEVPFTGIDEASDLFAVLLDALWPLTYLDEIPGDPHVLARRRSGAGTAAALRIAGAPVGALMRATAATGPRMLGLSRGKRS